MREGKYERSLAEKLTLPGQSYQICRLSATSVWEHGYRGLSLHTSVHRQTGKGRSRTPPASPPRARYPRTPVTCSAASCLVHGPGLRGPLPTQDDHLIRTLDSRPLDGLTGQGGLVGAHVELQIWRIEVEQQVQVIVTIHVH